jgi:hypothetical protein
MIQLIVTATVAPSSLILFTLMMKTKCRFLEEPYEVTFQKKAFFMTY